MEDLTVQELKEIIAFYRDKCSNLEFEILNHKLALIRSSKTNEQLTAQVKMLNDAIEAKRLAEEEVAKAKTSPKRTKTK